MGGITNYYHGESGVVVDCQRVSNRDQNAYVIRLDGDPHRTFAFDYGGDVGIDPLLEAGDRAIFVRSDEYTGVWVREGMHLYPDLESAIGRVTERRLCEHQPGEMVVRVHGIWTDQNVSQLTQQVTGSPSAERPATDVSFFLSFSSANVLLARQVHADLKHDARVEVWFDLEQAGEAPTHQEHIARWLQEAIYSRRGFLLMWSAAAADSSWVRKEITWAAERAVQDPDFRFIVLKMDETPIPSGLVESRHVIDCCDLWPVNGINEEVFAAVTGRSGRVDWRNIHRQHGLIIPPDEGSTGYEPFRSESGVADALRYWREDGELCWELQYHVGSVPKIALGRGEEEVVDLGIQPGGYVGFYICHRAPLVRFWPGVPVWMRSGDLNLRPENVLAEYRRSSGSRGERLWSRLA